MGVKAFSEFQSDLLFELGNRDDLDNYKASWINKAYLSLTTADKLFGIKRNFFFPELEKESTTSCTDGTAYVQTPARCLIVRDVWDTTNDFHLSKINWSTYQDKKGRADTDSEGDPKFWVVRGAVGSTNQYKKVYLYPTPSGGQGIQISYRAIPAKMEDDTDVTEIGIEWDEPILQLAVIQAHMRLKEYDHAKAKKTEWVENVANLIDIYNKENLARRSVRHPSYAYINNPYG